LRTSDVRKHATRDTSRPSLRGAKRRSNPGPRGQSFLGPGLLRSARNDGVTVCAPQPLVIPRACGVTSTPRPLDFITAVSGILDHPLSRMMTSGGNSHPPASSAPPHPSPRHSHTVRARRSRRSPPPLSNAGVSLTCHVEKFDATSTKQYLRRVTYHLMIHRQAVIPGSLRAPE
jgi:hypothetical protein